MAGTILERIQQATTVLVRGICVTEQPDRSTVRVSECGIYNFHVPQLTGAVTPEWEPAVAMSTTDRW